MWWGRTGWLSGAVRRTTVDVDSGTWIPALAPLIAAEQVSLPVWAPISSRIKEMLKSYKCILNANNEPGIVISTSDTGEQDRQP